MTPKNRIRNNARLVWVADLLTRAIVTAPAASAKLKHLELELAFLVSFVQPSCHPESNAPKSRAHRRMCRRGARWIDRELSKLEGVVDGRP
jgi:hypothetical protein